MSDSSKVQSSESVFVIGCPRSGTSALSWAIAEHPKYWTSAESNFLSYFFYDQWLYKQYKAGIIRDQRHWLSKNKVSYEEYAAYIGWGIDQLYLSRSKNKIWVEETPEYTLNGLDFAIMFPNAKFIHLIRDGRRVVHSMIHSGFTTVEWAKDFNLACKTWVRFIDKGLELQKTYPTRTFELRHENLVADPETQCRLIFEFLGAEYDGAPARYLRTERVNSSFKESPLVQKNIWPDWNKRQINAFKLIAGSTMRLLGYSLD